MTNREELKRSGLLDQYVLGLLDHERTEEVERMIEEDPELAREVARIRKDLNAYADLKDIGPPPGERTPRTAEEFRDLDHEVITAMMEHNHTLNIWRYVLMAACLILIGVAGYLFRLKEELRSDLVTERALHAQDEASHLRDMERGRAALINANSDWENLTSYNRPVDTGTLHIHVMEGAGIALVDLSDIKPPGPGQAYYLYSGSLSGLSEPEIVTGRQLNGLYVIPFHDADPVLRIYEWEAGREAPPVVEDQALAVIELP
ncbi:hypothetical protein CLV84_3769 [Neolewinella xylanilytica]|uniref:Anti-sigma-K factor rskA n=1 Tax=Neolewinella xylanilytica TaxID=1514080 RepID=A0A2S6I0V6_9BACT|nr:hypothetical protein [Neolewinella xylanilytica]PPK84607.1 hypothetical protein CLV84_3769 [Neolewinella xylanilytica]